VALGSSDTYASLSVDLFCLGLILAQIFSEPCTPPLPSVDFVPAEEYGVKQELFWGKRGWDRPPETRDHPLAWKSVRQLCVWEPPSTRTSARDLKVLWDQNSATAAVKQVSILDRLQSNQEVLEQKLDTTQAEVEALRQTTEQGFALMMQHQLATVKVSYLPRLCPPKGSAPSLCHNRERKEVLTRPAALHGW
jgi:hypothetical protein